MRQHIDLAWLRRQSHQTWFAETLTGIEPALNRVRVHELGWLSQGVSDDNVAPALVTNDSSGLLASSIVELRRFDALLLTVSLDTLAWTRRSLAALPKTPVVPIIGVLDGLQSGAMIDLLELGMTDFVQRAVCPQEFRARLINAVCRTPRYIPLREPVGVGQSKRTYLDPRNPARADPRQSQPGPSERLAVSHLVWPTVSFQENKQRVIELFERQYLRTALRRANGNITAAARLANKDRRSFWELMRRHKVTASN